MSEFMKIDAPRNFWLRIDTLRGNKSLKEIAKECDIKYQRIKEQRSLNRLPKLEDAYKLAQTLSTTIEFLLTGDTFFQPQFNTQILAIANACKTASEGDLNAIEKILGICPKKEAGSKIS